MVDKKEGRGHYTNEHVGIAGFTLGILSIVFVGWSGILVAIVGFFLCLYQQKKNPTRAGKIGFILNIIGFFLGIFFIIVYLKYLIPFIQQFSQAQNFPIA